MGYSRSFRIRRRLPPYQLLLALGLILAALFLLGHPPIPKDLNFKYQVDARTKEYPLVPVTSALVRGSVERVREVYRWNLTAETVAHNVPVLKGTPQALGLATFFIAVGIVACVMIFFVPRRRHVGLGMVILVIAGSQILSNAPAYFALAAVPSTLLPDAAATLVVRADPGHTVGIERGAHVGLKDLSDRYWDQYVTFTRVRMGHAGSILPDLKRLWFGISGLLYVAPFAMILGVFGALATLLQTLGWALLVLAPFAIAVAVMDGRAGIKIKDHVVIPFVVVHILLALLSAFLPLVLYSATAVHAAETQLGLLVIGSIFPILMTLGVALVWRRRGVKRRVRLGDGRTADFVEELPGGPGDPLHPGVFDHSRMD